MSIEPAWEDLAREITRVTGETFTIRARSDIGGGCIHRAVKLRDDGVAFFVKYNRADRVDMFETEAMGLQELRRCVALRVPEPVCWGVLSGVSYLVLEFIDLRPLADRAAIQLGEGLAKLHRHTHAQFGWSRANFIGATEQPNPADADWTRFWREQRLGFQLSLAIGKDDRFARPGEALLARVDRLLDGHAPVPSLLHGDLWAGNAAMDAQQQPVIFDPAVYYGDRETDLAMMELFGFPQASLTAYRAAWPLDSGYAEVRRDLYQLYHILNHFNLFGGHYADQALSMMRRLASQ